MNLISREELITAIESKGQIEVHPELTSDYSLFVYAIRSTVTREYYLRRLRRFFDFLGLKEGCTLEERCNYFAKLGKNELLNYN